MPLDTIKGVRVSHRTGERSHRISLPRETERLVESLCGDYARRERALRDKSARVLALRNYRHLNGAIREALLTVVTEEDLPLLLADIAGRRSRTRSPQAKVHPSTYAEWKRRAKYAIAERLRLV